MSALNKNADWEHFPFLICVNDFAIVHSALPPNNDPILDYTDNEYENIKQFFTHAATIDVNDVFKAINTIVKLTNTRDNVEKNTIRKNLDRASKKIPRNTFEVLTEIRLKHKLVHNWSDQQEMINAFGSYNSNNIKSNWDNWSRLGERYTQEIKQHEQIQDTLKTIFNIRSNINKIGSVPPVNQLQNPIWDEISYRIKLKRTHDDVIHSLVQDITGHGEHVKDINTKSLIHVIKQCETPGVTTENIFGFISWPLISLSNIPFGSSSEWAQYTSSRLNSLKENVKGSDINNTLGKIQENPKDNPLIFRLFIDPFSSIIDTAELSDLTIDSPTNRFKNFTRNPLVEWYSGSTIPGTNIDPKMLPVDSDGLKTYLTKMHKYITTNLTDFYGIFGWIQFLYFLGYDIHKSLYKLTEDIEQKLLIYKRSHITSEETVRDGLNRIMSYRNSIQIFWNYWRNTITTRFNLTPPIEYKNDAEWKLGYLEFGSLIDNEISTNGYRNIPGYIYLHTPPDKYKQPNTRQPTTKQPTTRQTDKQRRNNLFISYGGGYSDYQRGGTPTNRHRLRHSKWVPPPTPSDKVAAARLEEGMAVDKRKKEAEAQKHKHIFHSILGSVFNTTNELWFKKFAPNNHDNNSDIYDAFKWWTTPGVIDHSGSLLPFALGGASETSDSVDVFDCSSSFLRLVNLYSLIEKRASHSFWKSVNQKLLMSIPLNTLRTILKLNKYDALREEYRKHLDLLKAAYAGYIKAGINVKQSTDKGDSKIKSNVAEQSSRIRLFQENLIVQTLSTLLNKPGLNDVHIDMGGASVVEISELERDIKEIVDKMQEIDSTMKRDYPKYFSDFKRIYNDILTERSAQYSPNPGYVSYSPNPGSVSYSPNPGISGNPISISTQSVYITKAQDDVIVSDVFWGNLQKIYSINVNSRIYFPVSGEKQSSTAGLSPDFVLDYLKVIELIGGTFENTRFMKLGGIDWKSLISIVIKPVENERVFNVLLASGYLIVANDKTSLGNYRQWKQMSQGTLINYIEVRMREIAEHPTLIYTHANFRRVWFELLINNFAFNSVFSSSFKNNSKLLRYLVENCVRMASDFSKCKLVFSRDYILKALESLRIIPNFLFLTGTQRYPPRKTKIEMIINAGKNRKSPGALERFR